MIASPWGRAGFEPEAFVAECQAAAAGADPLGAVHEVVAAAIAEGLSIDAALGPGRTSRYPHPLLSSANLTVQRVVRTPGQLGSRHEHRMWAVIGVYASAEVNRLYERSPDGLTERGRCVVAAGDVMVLDADAIHSVENPGRDWASGLHVYGGDILAVARNAWGPDGREVAFEHDAAARIPMFKGMARAAADRGQPIDDDGWYLANRALAGAGDREGRYPTADEARRLVADAWAAAPRQSDRGPRVVS
jgi:predicted metal-dependent enzyme (double-stranded beta helix superfamily)